MAAAIAGVLRVGTIVAMAAVAAGFVLAIAIGGDGPGPTPVVELLGGAPADLLIAVGLLGLTSIPVVVVGVAAVGLARGGERTRAATAAVVLLLLLASLAGALIIGASS